MRNYEKPELKIVSIEAEDVITTSVSTPVIDNYTIDYDELKENLFAY